MTRVDREERHLMRQRGAGARSLIPKFNISFSSFRHKAVAEKQDVLLPRTPSRAKSLVRTKSKTPSRTPSRHGNQTPVRTNTSAKRRLDVAMTAAQSEQQLTPVVNKNGNIQSQSNVYSPSPRRSTSIRKSRSSVVYMSPSQRQRRVDTAAVGQTSKNEVIHHEADPTLNDQRMKEERSNKMNTANHAETVDNDLQFRRRKRTTEPPKPAEDLAQDENHIVERPLSTVTLNKRAILPPRLQLEDMPQTNFDTITSPNRKAKFKEHLDDDNDDVYDESDEPVRLTVLTMPLPIDSVDTTTDKDGKVVRNKSTKRRKKKPVTMPKSKKKTTTSKTTIISGGETHSSLHVSKRKATDYGDDDDDINSSKRIRSGPYTHSKPSISDNHSDVIRMEKIPKSSSSSKLSDLMSKTKTLLSSSSSTNKQTSSSDGDSKITTGSNLSRDKKDTSGTMGEKIKKGIFNHHSNNLVQKKTDEGWFTRKKGKNKS